MTKNYNTFFLYLLFQLLLGKEEEGNNGFGIFVNNRELQVLEEVELLANGFKLEKMMAYISRSSTGKVVKQPSKF